MNGHSLLHFTAEAPWLAADESSLFIPLMTRASEGGLPLPGRAFAFRRKEQRTTFQR